MAVAVAVAVAVAALVVETTFALNLGWGSGWTMRQTHYSLDCRHGRVLLSL